MTIEQGLNLYLKPLFQRKPESIAVLDVKNLTSYTDYIVIVTGRSERQNKSLADHMRQALKKEGKKALNIEGANTGKWILMDYGWIIVHIFDEETARLYDLKSMWSDAPEIDTSSFAV